MADLEKLVKTIDELEEQSKSLQDFNLVYTEIGKLKGDIESSLEVLNTNNSHLNNISSDIKGELNKFHSKFETIENTLFEKILELYKDNKNFQKDLDSSLNTLLKKHKSDIQIEFRNEGTQIQRAFETTLTSKFNEMESKLKLNFEAQSKHNNVLKVLLFVVIVICLGLGGVMYFKWF